MPLSSVAVTRFRSDTVRGAPGFFRVGQLFDGAWCFIDSDERTFFACAVNGVDDPVGCGSDRVAERLRRWHFKVIGAGATIEMRGERFPYVASGGFCTDAGPVIRARGIRLPDVFDPDWLARAVLRAGIVCAPRSDERRLLGWLSDDELGWGAPHSNGRPTLLQVCLSLEPGFAAYHAAWEFVLAPHQGKLAKLAAAWGQPLANKEVVREMTRTEQVLAARGYLKDNARWTREFARRYFTATAEAIRAAAPNHLLLGARATHGGSIEASEAAAGFVDVPWVSWRHAGAWRTGPTFVDDFNWTAPEFLQVGAGRRANGLTTVERMLRRGRVALKRMVTDPNVVGYAWSRWRDRLGEQAPFGSGLVRADDTEASEHTELIADIQGRAASLRGLAVS